MVDPRADAPVHAHAARRARWILAGLALVAAVAWSPWGLDWLIGSGSIEGVEWWITLALGAGLSLGAVRTLARPLPRAAIGLHTALVTTFLGIPLLAEGILRYALGSGRFDVCQPGLYADPFTDDDYWKLMRRWGTRSVGTVDPALGWSTRVSEENPLGVVRPDGYEPQTENVVLCFGDSFMAHAPIPYPHKIPDVLEQLLVDRTVYNYGVGGYGVGQMFLRFKKTHPDFVDPVVIIGIMWSDLDRSILSVRKAPKPHFVLQGDELVLEGVPILDDVDGWHLEHPPAIKSYFLAWLVLQARTRTASNASELAYGRARKRRLNRAIIEAIVEEARAHSLRLLFLTFPTRYQASRGSWREEFLRETFESLEVPWIDGRAVLSEVARHEDSRFPDYYRENNHPNERANHLFARVVAERLHELWGFELR